MLLHTARRPWRKAGRRGHPAVCLGSATGRGCFAHDGSSSCVRGYQNFVKPHPLAPLGAMVAPVTPGSSPGPVTRRAAAAAAVAAAAGAAAPRNQTGDLNAHHSIEQIPLIGRNPAEEDIYSPIDRRSAVGRVKQRALCVLHPHLPLSLPCARRRRRRNKPWSPGPIILPGVPYHCFRARARAWPAARGVSRAVERSQPAHLSAPVAGARGRLGRPVLAPAGAAAHSGAVRCRVTH